MQRRDFIAALGGAAAWPLAAHAPQAERMQAGKRAIEVTRVRITEAGRQVL